MRRIGVAAILILACAAVAGLAFRPGGAETGQAERAAALPVETVTAHRVDGYSVTRAYIGQVVPRRRSDLAFERGGLVAEVLVDEGARVETGQVLARLDTERLEAEKVRLEAELRRVEAQLDSARLTAERQRRLVRRGHSSRAQYDDARFAARALAAQRDSVQASIQTIEVDLHKSELKAPFAGIVAARRVDEGSVINAGQTVLRLSESGELEARVGVPADLARHMPVGSSHRLDIEGGTYHGTVTAVSPVVDPATRTVEIIFTLSTASYVADGVIVRLSVDRRIDRQGFWLPATALSEGIRGLWRVFVMAPDPEEAGTYRVRRREVEILHLRSDRVFVRGTLEEGDKVIAAGGHRLVVGQRVSEARGQTAASD
jgi:RND family efflux transporter MFP subunit